MKVKHLKRQTINSTTVLLCTNCYGEYSADSRDYFLADQEDDLKCCQKSLVLVNKQIIYTQNGY